MSHIYTGLDIGNGEVKIVVVKAFEKECYVLDSVSVETLGLKKNVIYDEKKLKASILNALKKIESNLGISVNEVVLSLPTIRASMTMENSFVNIKDDYVKGKDISKLLKEVSVDTYDSDRMLVSVLPISFTVDDNISVSNPLGEKGEKLFLKAVVATSPKNDLYPLINIVRSVGINITDVIYNTQADYYTVMSKDLDRKLGVVVNIGADITNIGVFNKGIMIKSSYIPLGSSSVDKDISFIYKVSVSCAKTIKESFALALARYADDNEKINVTTTEGKKITISQIQVSEVIESRLKEILKLVKNEINRLTKREISYIIVVGGISELAGFNYIVEEVLGKYASCYNMKNLGARHNKYASAFGCCKYFAIRSMLLERNKDMLDINDVNNLVSPKIKNNNNDIKANKFLGHFFDN